MTFTCKSGNMFCNKDLPKQVTALLITLSELTVYFDTFRCAHFFTINTKLPKLSMLASKVLFTAAKKVISSGAQTDDHYVKSLMLSLLR